MNPWLTFGGIWGFVGVAMGAFGAHALKAHDKILKNLREKGKSSGLTTVSGLVSIVIVKYSLV